MQRAIDGADSVRDYVRRFAAILPAASRECPCCGGRLKGHGRYARNAIAFADTTIADITCHATGVRRLVPDAATVIEIGGQDSKLVRIAPDGTVRDFAMNDRCAAGS